jgi:hypothetical protein
MLKRTETRELNTALRPFGYRILRRQTAAGVRARKPPILAPGRTITALQSAEDSVLASAPIDKRHPCPAGKINRAGHPGNGISGQTILLSLAAGGLHFLTASRASDARSTSSWRCSPFRSLRSFGLISFLHAQSSADRGSVTSSRRRGVQDALVEQGSSFDFSRYSNAPGWSSSSDELLGPMNCSIAKASRSSDKRCSTNRNSMSLKRDLRRP